MGTAESTDAEILILGASFTGIELLHQLRRLPGGRHLRVVVIDRHRSHGYIPLVHERLCGRLAPGASELATAAAVTGDPAAEFVTGEITGLDPATKTVELADGSRLTGRFVVVTLGSELAPPPGLAGGEHLSVYKLADEQGAAATALAARLTGGGGASPTIAVIGGGISGVELAGELALLARVRPAGWRAPRVVLIHRGAQLLPGFAPRVARRCARHLAAQGVELRLGTTVLAADPGGLELAAGDRGAHRLATEMSFWSGGIRPAPILADLPLPRTAAGWLEVGPTLQCWPTVQPTHPELFAAGDAVRIRGGDGEWPTMQRAIECLWQAKVLARNLVTLAAAPVGYPEGIPPLTPHRLRRDFFHGISLGGRSLVVYGRLIVDLAGINTWFRRFLMRAYFARYRSSGGG